MKYRFSGVLLVTNNNEVISMHRDDISTIRDPGCYGIFGGASEGNESPLETAVREISEETNLVPTPKELELFRTYRQQRDNLPELAEFTVFVLKNINPNILQTYEGQGIKILRNANDPNIAPDVKIAFTDWFTLHPLQN